MKTLFISLKITIAFCVILFVGYVLVLWGFAAIVAPNSGQAEVITANGRVVGAANVGQQFTQVQYFWGRPSAVDYNGSGSGGSNKAPSNTQYLAQVADRIDTLLKYNPSLDRSDIPSELVTASGSGLDPHISPAAATVQIERVAIARSIEPSRIAALVDQLTVQPLIGTPYINVVELNVALDGMTKN